MFGPAIGQISPPPAIAIQAGIIGRPPIGSSLLGSLQRLELFAS